MDIRRTGFFGLLTLNGRALELVQSKGSPMGIVAESLKTLAGERSRLSDGELEIVLRIKNKPFDTSKDGVLNLGKVEELEALIDDHFIDDTPNRDESYESYYQRLLALDYIPSAAEFVAAQWFQREVNPTTTLWLNDPRAIRFRELNSRDEAFEGAHPSEYESLKNYVKTTYPEFVEHLTFRTA